MAITFTSPGVQINEKDLSLRANLPVGTNIVVPGFASQGPTIEPLLITSVSELEATYGIPSTPAERYFHYTCREILNSPGTLTTVRLPYGANAGSDFSTAYSGLFYPVLSSVGTITIGQPIHTTLTPNQYQAIRNGNINWGPLSGTNAISWDSSTSTVTVSAGFFVLNDLQTTINENSEGYYVGIANNASPATNGYTAVSGIYTLGSVSTGTAISDTYSTLLSSRYTETTYLTSSVVDSKSSISEALQNVGFQAFYDSGDYNDQITLGIFRARRSTTDGRQLTFNLAEKYYGSFDHNRRTNSQTGGSIQSAFVSDIVNNNSSIIEVHTNPALSKQYGWVTNGTRNQVNIQGGAQNLYPLGVYTPDAATSAEATKTIGNIPQKLDKVLRLLGSTENTDVDIIVDAGLTTINATTIQAGTNNFEDTYYVSNVGDTTFQSNWTTVAATFQNFAQNTRKDCVAIVDPLRQIFISGRDSKVIEDPNKTFTADIYNNLKPLANINSNYVATYGNWVKVNDVYSGKMVWIPFSGYAAAAFARNDSVAQPWSAPGGLNRGLFNAIDIAFNPNQKQRDRLYEISVNPVVFFNGDGYAIFGQKTLQTKPTAFDRINVRRLFLSLERSVQKTIKYFVFEPNTDFTRTRIKNTLTPIFEYAKNTEGLYDYLIVVDERNNTPDIIDQNQLIVDIYIKPVRTAEFILVNFIATRTGQNFQELI